MLIGIAVCIADSVHRAGDCAARFGGEEFAVLLPGLSAADALTVAESIRSKVERWSLDQTGVTISVGVASLMPAPSLHWSELVEAADKALYVAKESGRNRLRGRGPPRAAAAGGVSSPAPPRLCPLTRRDSASWWRAVRRADRRAASPKAILARRKPALEPQSWRSPSNSMP